jgi:TonB family protein
MRSYPAEAKGTHEGLARIGCRPAPGGELADCAILSEEPTGEGFGQAALALMPAFRMTKKAAKERAAGIVLPSRFAVPEPSPPWREAAYRRSSSYGYLGPPGPYFPDRAARSGVGGEVVADCHVGDGGRLDSCRIVAVAPAEFGFDDAVLKMVEQGWMTAAPASEGVAAPSNGIWRFRVPFRDSRAHYSR